MDHFLESCIKLKMHDFLHLILNQPAAGTHLCEVMFQTFNLTEPHGHRKPILSLMAVYPLNNWPNLPLRVP